MKLYVCYGTFNPRLNPRPGGHPCGNAYDALTDAGYEPEVIKTYGLGPLPDFLNSPRRRELKSRTGSSWVPVLETDSGELIRESRNIIAWAKQHPAGATATPI